MKRRIKTLFISLLAVFACVLLVPSIVSFANTSNSYSFNFSGSFEDFYQIGDQLVVPTAVATNGTKTYTADVNIILPNNTATKNSTLKLTETGSYTIEYKAYLEDQQKYLVQSFEIVVNNSLFSVIGEGNIDYLEHSSSISGAVATLYNGDTFVYNNYVDLKEMNGNPLFKMIPYPQIVGEADVNKLTIQITDVHDENKFVVVRLKKSQETSEGKDWAWYCCYVDANFSDDGYSSPYVGMKYDEKGKFECNGQKYSIVKNSEKYGTEVSFSLTGGVTGAAVSAKEYGLSYNYEKNQIFNNIIAGTSVNKQLISNFADINIFPQLFNGFTDGKVKISITPEGYNKSYCKLVFTEFAGKPIIKEGYNAFKYNQSPDINIDFDTYTETTVPYGLPNVEYSIFNATAFDFVEGKLPVSTKVYYGYSNANKVNVDVIDGKFVPKFTGLYTIEYTAENSFGNATVKTVDVFVSPKESKLSFDVDNFVSSATIGSEINLVSGYSADNAYGNTSLKIYVELSTDSSVKYELTEDNVYTFKPLYSGTYNVKLICSDNVESVSIDKTLVVSASEYVIYNVDGSFPNYLLLNGTYTLPKVVATDLSSGKPVSTQTQLVLITPDGSESESNGEVTVKNDDYIILSYKPVGLAWAQPYQVKLPIIETGLGTSKIYKEKYFVTTSGAFTKGSSSDDTYYAISELNNGVASMEFANILQGNNFTLSLAPYIGESGYKNIDSISILLKDVVNSERFVKLTASIKNDGVYFAVNDGSLMKIANSWGEVKDNLLVDYNILTSTLIINSSFDMNVESFFGTNELVVFEKGLFLEISISAPSIGGGVRISSINGQILSSSLRDRNAPIIDSSMNNNKGEYDINDIVTFYPYKAYDVLSPTVNFSFSIKTPNGAYAVATDGTVLNGNQDITKTYQLKLDTYGDYEVYPVAVDVINLVSNTNTSYKINVVDKRLPVITLGDYQKTAKLNESFTIATFSVDVSDCITFVAIVNPIGIYEIVKDNKYLPKLKGKYEIIISVIDSNDNMALCSYFVTVK
ncbi:MAG: hypothetical protein J6U92_00175 [Clostridia bacterium]|nr:hypothetical protein [Clostridia bacterium]